MEVEYEVHFDKDINFRKYVKDEDDIKLYDSVGWYVDRSVEADIDRKIDIEVWIHWWWSIQWFLWWSWNCWCWVSLVKNWIWNWFL